MTIAEVEEIVECGEIGPDEVHVPGVYIQRVVRGDAYEKRIEVCGIVYLSSFCCCIIVVYS